MEARESGVRKLFKLKRNFPGNYTTDDGFFNVEFVDNYETECDEAHPMRISRADREWFAGLSAFEKEQFSRSHWTKYWALLNRQKGYFCDGGETHYYSRWIVWDNGADDYPAESGPDGFDTKKDAVEFLKRLYAKKAVTT